MTTEPLEAAPACRHLVAVRGGSLACTLGQAHLGHVHEDGDVRDHNGRPVRWSCSDPGTPSLLRVSVCLTFDGYLTDTQTG